MALVLHPYPWPNNDVLAFPVGRLLKGGQGVSRLQPIRLTKNLSMATALRAHATDKRVYVVWAGRTRVGSDVISAGKPPEIFYTTLPLE
jgi:hypothetical protein